MELTFTVRNVLLGSSLLGLVGGALGCFALLRRQSLLGDALAHTALPGVCIAYLITGSKDPVALLAGALVAGLFGSLVILTVVRGSRISEDSAIGIVLSVFFGIGIVLLTYIQHLPLANQSGLDKFLFGQAATLMPRDLQVMGVLGLLVLAATVLFFKELELLCFDREFGESLGFPMRRVELLLTLLLVIVVVVGLQTVGVVLIVATLVTPAAAARQWTDRLAAMVLLSALIGALSGVSGAMLSASIARVPTGPVIVLCSSAVLVVSLLLAPQRGLVFSALRQRRVARRIRQENLLKDLYRWGERVGGDWTVAVPWSFLMGGRGQSGPQLGRVGRGLEAQALVAQRPQGVVLTRRGLNAARRLVRKHRLWELYLTRRLEIQSDHVHRDADAMEHTLSDEAVERLDGLLGHPAVDPHGRPIPAATSPAEADRETA